MYLEQENLYNAFKGEWNDGKPNGKGIFYDNKSKIMFEGLFKDGFPE